LAGDGAAGLAPAVGPAAGLPAPAAGAAGFLALTSLVLDSALLFLAGIVR
jgi:hypothetical protein